MPRINIEDTLFRDLRWFKLVIKVGCQYKALGMITQSWVLAQEHWIEHKAVPIKAWPEELNVLVEIGLAEKINNELIYVKGSKNAFAWLEQRVEAGRKGGLAHRKMTQECTPEELLLRNKARKAVANAVHRGKIEKPSRCDICDIGGVVIEAHHSDYKKPFDVDWVCKRCHHSIHLSLSKQAGAKQSAEPDKLPMSPAKPQDRSLDLSLNIDPTYSKIDIKKKDLTNLVDPTSVEPKKNSVQTHTVKNKDLYFFINKKLLELYPMEYLEREKKKMEMWLAANSHKSPKSDRGMIRFVTGWLSRSWDQYRKGLNSNAPKEKTLSEALAEEQGVHSGY